MISENSFKLQSLESLYKFERISKQTVIALAFRIMVRAVFNSVLEVIRQLLNGVGFTPVPNGLSSPINK